MKDILEEVKDLETKIASLREKNENPQKIQELEQTLQILMQSGEFDRALKERYGRGISTIGYITLKE